MKGSGKNPFSGLFAEIGGTIGEDIFESSFGRKLGREIAKGYLLTQEQQQLAQEAQRLDVSIAALIGGVSVFLSSVSIVRPSLSAGGKSDLLLRRLRPVNKAMRMDTKIRRLVSVLQEVRAEPLISNAGIPLRLELDRRNEIEQGASYKTMQRLETTIRSSVSSRLSTIAPGWWITRVPEDIRTRAEERKAKNEKQYPWDEEPKVHPIHYVDFPDYTKIILRKDNWSDVFVSIFGDREVISVKLRELEPIRNSIAHSRKLTRAQETKLELYASEILRSLGYQRTSQ